MNMTGMSALDFENMVIDEVLDLEVEYERRVDVDEYTTLYKGKPVYSVEVEAHTETYTENGETYTVFVIEHTAYLDADAWAYTCEVEDEIRDVIADFAQAYINANEIDDYEIR